jgi:hypothetical protein
MSKQNHAEKYATPINADDSKQTDTNGGVGVNSTAFWEPPLRPWDVPGAKRRPPVYLLDTLARGKWFVDWLAWHNQLPDSAQPQIAFDKKTGRLLTPEEIRRRRKISRDVLFDNYP